TNQNCHEVVSFGVSFKATNAYQRTADTTTAMIHATALLGITAKYCQTIVSTYGAKMSDARSKRSRKLFRLRLGNARMLLMMIGREVSRAQFVAQNLNLIIELLRTPRDRMQHQPD